MENISFFSLNRRSCAISCIDQYMDATIPNHVDTDRKIKLQSVLNIDQIGQTSTKKSLLGRPRDAIDSSLKTT